MDRKVNDWALCRDISRSLVGTVQGLLSKAFTSSSFYWKPISFISSPFQLPSTQWGSCRVFQKHCQIPRTCQVAKEQFVQWMNEDKYNGRRWKESAYGICRAPEHSLGSRFLSWMVLQWTFKIFLKFCDIKHKSGPARWPIKETC